MPKDTNFPCSYCEFTSKYRKSISNHIKAIHEKRRDFKCSLCDYATYLRKDLSKHTKAVHEKIKDIVCEQCDYRCSEKGDLTHHVKIVHKGIREYECNQCEKKFGTNTELKRHVKLIHEKEKQVPENDHEEDHAHDEVSVWECKKCVHRAKRQVMDECDLVKGDPWTCATCGFTSSKLSELAEHVEEPCDLMQDWE